MLFITARVRRSEVFLRNAKVVDVADSLLFRRYCVQLAKRRALEALSRRNDAEKTLGLAVHHHSRRIMLEQLDRVRWRFRRTRSLRPLVLVPPRAQVHDAHLRIMLAGRQRDGAASAGGAPRAWEAEGTQSQLEAARAHSLPHRRGGLAVGPGELELAPTTTWPSSTQPAASGALGGAQSLVDHDHDAPTLRELDEILAEESELNVEEHRSRLLAALRVRATVVKALARRRRQSALLEAFKVQPVVQLAHRPAEDTPGAGSPLGDGRREATQPQSADFGEVTPPASPPGSPSWQHGEFSGWRSFPNRSPDIRARVTSTAHLNPLFQHLNALDDLRQLSDHNFERRPSQWARGRRHVVNSVRSVASAALGAAKELEPVCMPPSQRTRTGQSRSLDSPTVGASRRPMQRSSGFANASSRTLSHELDTCHLEIRWDAIPAFVAANLGAPFPPKRTRAIYAIGLFNVVAYLALPNVLSIPIQIVRHLAPFSGTLFCMALYVYDNVCTPMVRPSLLQSSRSVLLLGWATANFLMSFAFMDESELVPTGGWVHSFAILMAATFVCSLDSLYTRNAGLERGLVTVLAAALVRAIAYLIFAPGPADILFRDDSRGMTVTTTDLRIVIFVQMLANLQQTVTTAYLDPTHQFTLFRERSICKDDALCILRKRSVARVKQRVRVVADVQAQAEEGGASASSGLAGSTWAIKPGHVIDEL